MQPATSRYWQLKTHTYRIIGGIYEDTNRNRTKRRGAYITLYNTVQQAVIEEGYNG